MSKGCLFVGLLVIGLLDLIVCYIGNSSSAFFVGGGFLLIIGSLIALIIPEKRNRYERD